MAPAIQQPWLAGLQEHSAAGSLLQCDLGTHRQATPTIGNFPAPALERANDGLVATEVACEAAASLHVFAAVRDV